MINRGFWVDKRVLVTGHTGFKGTWLSLLLSEMGASVYGLSLPPDTDLSLFNQVNLSKHVKENLMGDICDFTSLSETIELSAPDIVFHLAAQPLVMQSYINPLLTWQTNVNGSLNLLESLRRQEKPCAVVMITTDKVYENRGWDFGYRETDRLGGHDPYSASKAAAELAIASWRNSFCGTASHQNSNLFISTARSGNVIGGGDWALDRIVPDVIRSISAGRTVKLRNPKATRPWQHVLEPLSGYIVIAEKLFSDQTQSSQFCTAYNFGPAKESVCTVKKLVETMLCYWPGEWALADPYSQYHEASRLALNTDKVYVHTGWKSKWDFVSTIQRTVCWYRSNYEGKKALDLCLENIYDYITS